MESDKKKDYITPDNHPSENETSDKTKSSDSYLKNTTTAGKDNLMPDPDDFDEGDSNYSSDDSERDAIHSDDL